MEFRDDDLALELGLTNLSLDTASVDCEITQICKQLLGTVLRANEVKERWGVVNKCGPAVAVDEYLVCQKRGKEGDVRLCYASATCPGEIRPRKGLKLTDAPDPKLYDGPQDLATSNLVCGAMALGCGCQFSCTK